MSTLIFYDDFVSVTTDAMYDASAMIFNPVTLSYVEGNKFDPWQFFLFLTPAPFEYVIITAALMQFCCVFLNTLVFVYYRKLKEITRPYILSLIALDLLLGVVTLTSFVIVIASPSAAVALIAYKIFYITFVFGFGFYLYPPFFLACDRFLIVMFPLKYNDYLRRVKVIKVALFSIHFLNQSFLSVLPFIFDPEAMFFKLTALVSVFFNVAVSFGTLFLYVIMVVQIFRSSKKMSNSRAKKNNSK